LVDPDQVARGSRKAQSYAVTTLTEAAEKEIVRLVRKAVG